MSAVTTDPAGPGTETDPEAAHSTEHVQAPMQRWKAGLPTIAAWALFALMVLYGQVVYGRIIQYATISNLLINNAHMLIIAVGLTLVIITGGIDLSVGSVIAVSSVSGAMLAQLGWNPWLVVLLFILVGTLFGLMSAGLVEYAGMQPFIATLVMLFLARGVASTLSTEPERIEPDSPIRDLNHAFKLYDGPKVDDLVVTPGVLIAVAVIVLGIFLTRRTRFGRTVYALGGSPDAAELMGLPVRNTRLAVYILSGTLSGVAAVVYTSRLGSAQNITGIGWELTAIAAVVIGGTLLTGGRGSVAGSVVGVLVLGMMNVLITRDGGIPPEMTTIITGSILFVFVLLQRVVVGRSQR